MLPTKQSCSRADVAVRNTCKQMNVIGNIRSELGILQKHGRELRDALMKRGSSLGEVTHSVCAMENAVEGLNKLLGVVEKELEKLHQEGKKLDEKYEELLKEKATLDEGHTKLHLQLSSRLNQRIVTMLSAEDLASMECFRDDAKERLASRKAEIQLARDRHLELSQKLDSQYELLSKAVLDRQKRREPFCQQLDEFDEMKMTSIKEWMNSQTDEETLSVAQKALDILLCEKNQRHLAEKESYQKIELRRLERQIENSLRQKDALLKELEKQEQKRQLDKTAVDTEGLEEPEGEGEEGERHTTLHACAPSPNLARLGLPRRNELRVEVIDDDDDDDDDDDEEVEAGEDSSRCRHAGGTILHRCPKVMNISLDSLASSSSDFGDRDSSPDSIVHHLLSVPDDVTERAKKRVDKDTAQVRAASKVKGIPSSMKRTQGSAMATERVEGVGGVNRDRLSLSPPISLVKAASEKGLTPITEEELPETQILGNGDAAQTQEVTACEEQTTLAEKAEKTVKVKDTLDPRELLSGDASCKEEQTPPTRGPGATRRERSPGRLQGGRRSPVVTSERLPVNRKVTDLQADPADAEKAVAGGDVHKEHALKAARATTCFSHLTSALESEAGLSHRLGLDQCSSALGGSDSCLAEIAAVASPPRSGSFESRRRQKPRAAEI